MSPRHEPSGSLRSGENKRIQLKLQAAEDDVGEVKSGMTKRKMMRENVGLVIKWSSAEGDLNQYRFADRLAVPRGPSAGSPPTDCPIRWPTYDGN